MAAYTVFARVLEMVHGQHKSEMADAERVYTRAKNALGTVRGVVAHDPDAVLLKSMEDAVARARDRVERASACVRRDATLREELTYAIEAMAHIERTRGSIAATPDWLDVGLRVTIAAGRWRGKKGTVERVETNSWGVVMCQLAMEGAHGGGLEMVECHLLEAA